MVRTIADRSMIITGASSGIGAATALACARAGMHLVLNGRAADRLEHVAQQVRELGRQAETIVGDVTEPGLSDRLLDRAEQLPGGIYAVFANAGYGYKRPAHELSLDELRQMFDVNFFAAYELLQLAARRLIAAGRPGHLLMCSSALAKFAMINFSAYSATKAAQNHVCRAMRVELRQHRIEVASVHPVTTRTDFFRRSGVASGERVDPERVFDHVPRWLLQPAERVAGAVVRCLRRPVPEVWTSLLTRVTAGVITIFPRLARHTGPAGSDAGSLIA